MSKKKADIVEEVLIGEPIRMPTSAKEELEDNGIFMLYDEIDKFSVQGIIQKLILLHSKSSFQDEIQIIINSPGGYVNAGWALIDIMNFIRMPVRTIAMGEICSMATYIFIAGSKRIMAPNSIAMIHQFSAENYGKYSDLLASRKAEDIEQAKGIAHLIKNSKYTSEKQIKENLLKSSDLWLTPKEMKKHGLCDAIYNT